MHTSQHAKNLQTLFNIHTGFEGGEFQKHRIYLSCNQAAQGEAENRKALLFHFESGGMLVTPKAPHGAYDEKFAEALQQKLRSTGIILADYGNPPSRVLRFIYALPVDDLPLELLQRIAVISQRQNLVIEALDSFSKIFTPGTFDFGEDTTASFSQFFGLQEVTQLRPALKQLLQACEATDSNSILKDLKEWILDLHATLGLSKFKIKGYLIGRFCYLPN